MFGQLVKGGINDLDVLSADGFLHIRHFFRSLIDKKYDEIRLGIALKNGLGNIFQERRLSGFRRGDDHASLSLADRADEVYNPRRPGSVRPLQLDPLIREDRSHILKNRAVSRFLGGSVIDHRDMKKRTVLFTLRAIPLFAGDHIAGLQIEAADLGGRNIDIFFTR